MSHIQYTDIRLPDKPSELLALALADLAVVETSDDYRVDMGVWHDYSPHRQVCSVCLAGAVLTRHIPSDVSVYSPGEYQLFELDVANKLDSIDLLRCGLIGAAVEAVGLELSPDSRKIWPVTMYEEDPEDFREAMGQIVNYLKLQGM